MNSGDLYLNELNTIKSCNCFSSDRFWNNLDSIVDLIIAIKYFHDTSPLTHLTHPCLKESWPQLASACINKIPARGRCLRREKIKTFSLPSPPEELSIFFLQGFQNLMSLSSLFHSILKSKVMYTRELHAGILMVLRF